MPRQDEQGAPFLVLPPPSRPLDVTPQPRFIARGMGADCRPLLQGISAVEPSELLAAPVAENERRAFPDQRVRLLAFGPGGAA